MISSLFVNRCHLYNAAVYLLLFFYPLIAPPKGACLHMCAHSVGAVSVSVSLSKRISAKFYILSNPKKSPFKTQIV